MLSLKVNVLWVIESITAKPSVIHQDPNYFLALYVTYSSQYQANRLFIPVYQGFKKDEDEILIYDICKEMRSWSCIIFTMYKKFVCYIVNYVVTLISMNI